MSKKSINLDSFENKLAFPKQYGEESRLGIKITLDNSYPLLERISKDLLEKTSEDAVLLKRLKLTKMPPKMGKTYHKYLTCLAVVLNNLAVSRAFRGDDYILTVTTRSANWGKKSSYIKAMVDLQYPFAEGVFKSVLALLSYWGILDLQKGFKDFKQDKRFKTRLRHTAKFNKLLPQSETVLPPLNDANVPFAILRDVKLKGDSKGKQLPFPDDEFYQVVREFVAAHQEVMTENEIKLGTGEIIPANYFRLKRIYNNGSIELGGRFNCFGQNFSKAVRQSIKINNTAVTEVDYTSIHMSLLYALNGLDPTLQANEVDGVLLNTNYLTDFEYNGVVYLVPKEIGKSLVLACLNTEAEYVENPFGELEEAKSGRDKAAKVLISRINMNKHKYQSEEANKIVELMNSCDNSMSIINLILDAFEQRHSAVSDSFYSGAWAELFLHESNLVAQVLSAFNALGYPIIPIHDSFIVSEDHQIELKGMMFSAFMELFDNELDVSKSDALFTVEY